MHNFKANYDKILDILNEIEEKSNFLQQIRLPKLTDKELIAVNLTAEYMGLILNINLLSLCLFKNRTKCL